MMPNDHIDKIISPLIPSQFPAFYYTDGPNFIAFVKAYYEWLEQAPTTPYVGSITTETRSLLDYLDIDLTQDRFLKYFKDTYLADFPQNLTTDWRLFIKHALDFYSSKGTDVSYELLFRFLYNQDVKVDNPGKYMFRTSNATWKMPKYIETSDSPFFNQLTGKLIRGSSGGTAVVESVVQKIVNKKTINIINISSMTGEFVYGDFIFCDSIPAMTRAEAPIVGGSLSIITIENGGINFKVGDELAITGTGYGGIGRVASIAYENGKVAFDLIDGGYGFSKNAIISIDNTDTGGTGASFAIGDLIDTQLIRLNTDTISGMVNTLTDLSTSGLHVNISNRSAPFLNNELASGTALSRQLDIMTIYQPAGPLANGDVLVNDSLGIANVQVYIADGSELYVTSNSQVLDSITAGIVLTSGGGIQVQVNYASPPSTITANGIVISSGSNSSVLSVHRIDGADIGYYPSGMLITGNTSGATATVISTTRLTDWGYFPDAFGASNLDSIIGDTFTTVTMDIGRIASLTSANPGSGYVSAPEISIIEPLIYDLQIGDGGGGYWGFDAIVDATAGSSNGIVTGLKVVDSGYGYYPGEFLILSSAGNESAVFGRAIVETSGTGKGYWLDTQGFLSDVMKLQDSYYYQAFSYELQTEQMLSSYEQIVKDVAHPVGYRLFGTYAVNRSFENAGAVLLYSVFSQPVELMLTADDTLLTSDETDITSDAEGLYHG